MNILVSRGRREGGAEKIHKNENISAFIVCCAEP
jgi:hypothetical protein